MKRRDFITVLGGTVAVWPLASRAQKPRKWRVGFLHPGESSAHLSTRIDAFRDGLGAPGGDAEIVARFANEQLGKLPAMAVELVDQNVEAICAVGPPAVFAARAATRSTPIIALDLESNPVANGWVASLAHPGGNVTGVFLDLPDFKAKSLQFLREAVPTLTKAAVLWHPASGDLQLEAVRKAASALSVTLEVFEVSRTSDFGSTFQAVARAQVGGVLMLSAPLFNSNPQLLADLTLQGRLPAINIFPDFARKGGLVAYGPEIQSLFMQAGVMTRKVLQGAAPAEFPVERPVRFRLVVNLKAARALNVTLPTSVLLSVDETIE